MGQKIVLTDTFSDASLPILYPDPIISAGSLALLDFGHSLGGVQGVPANGALIPNVAWQSANALVAGAPGQGALSHVMGNAGISASFPVIERTPKLGLHGIKSQVNDVSGPALYVSLAASIRDYLNANNSHAYFLSFWHNITRGVTTTGAPYPGWAAIIQQSTSICLLSVGPNTAAVGKSTLTDYGALAAQTFSTTPGINKITSAVSGFTGTYPGALTTATAYAIGGNTGGGGYGSFHVGASSILYRFYLEDLTVSGRTPAQVKAIDDALYSAAFAVGGKFAGDTFTAPSGFP